MDTTVKGIVRGKRNIERPLGVSFGRNENVQKKFGFQVAVIYTLAKEALMEKMIAFYMRVSLIDRQTVANQRLAIDKEIQRLGLRDKDYRIYEDECSGSVFQREGLDDLKEDIKTGRIKEVVIWKLDRLGRSIRDLLNLIGFFEEHGIVFRSLTENIDTGTATGRLMVHILASFAEFERGLVSERTKLAIWNARKHGIQIGRPKGSKDKRYSHKRRSRGSRVGWEHRRANGKRRHIPDHRGVNTESIEELVNA